MSRTLYDVLGVAEDADPDAVDDAYRDRVKEYHPDLSDDPDAEEQFRWLTRAKDVLIDPDERARYDRLGHVAYCDAEGWADGAAAADSMEHPDSHARARHAGGRSAGSRAPGPAGGSTRRRSSGGVNAHRAAERDTRWSGASRRTRGGGSTFQRGGGADAGSGPGFGGPRSSRSEPRNEGLDEETMAERLSILRHRREHRTAFDAIVSGIGTVLLVYVGVLFKCPGTYGCAVGPLFAWLPVAGQLLAIALPFLIGILVLLVLTVPFLYALLDEDYKL